MLGDSMNHIGGTGKNLLYRGYGAMGASYPV